MPGGVIKTGDRTFLFSVIFFVLSILVNSFNIKFALLQIYYTGGVIKTAPFNFQFFPCFVNSSLYTYV